MSNFDKQEISIAGIFDGDEVHEVDDRTLRIFFGYLQKNLEFPCNLSGIEVFSWEERYVLGGYDKTEYEKLKKTQPSYTDTFKLLGFDGEIDENYGLLVNVRRVSDNKKFTLPLVLLEVIDKQSKNFQLVDDYCVWFVNYNN